MGHVEVSGLRHVLPDGRELFADVSFRVGEGQKVALVGANGAGKTTLLRMIAGDLPVVEGTIVRSGGLGVMRQFLGRPERGRDRAVAHEPTLQNLALSLAPPSIRAAGARLAAAERRGHPRPMVRPLVRPLPAVSRRRRGGRDAGTRVGRAVTVRCGDRTITAVDRRR
jgi:energy-coupling factor transporter ATP-binding protein EcfA2